MRAFFLLCLVAAMTGGTAHAQYQNGRWLHAAYTYTDFNYQESVLVSDKAQLGGARGEIGLNLLGLVAVSAGGSYQDGHTLYNGATLGGSTTQQVITNDWISDANAMVHLVYSPIVLSGGIGERFWSSHLPGAYRRQNRFTYHPVQVTYATGSLYVTVEEDLWSKGSSKVSLSEGSAAAHDVQFALIKGMGVGGEIGYLIPGQFFATHIFVRYHRWDIKASDAQSDGVATLTEPDQTTTLIEGGIGIAF